MGMSDYNRTEAFKSINNVRDNFNYSFNLTEDPVLGNLTNATALEQPDTAAKTLFIPISEFWARPDVWGSYFYVGLIIFTVGSIYAKSQNLFRTSIAMLIMSLIVAVPGTTGAFYIPSVALHTLYVFTGISIAGVLYSMWVGE
ncbi:MAG: hypothetical protein QM426_10530 [Euryarchaeota archaeon]|nr:hypothetical protein [Euryarchaeota archaeon]